MPLTEVTTSPVLSNASGERISLAYTRKVIRQNIRRWLAYTDYTCGHAILPSDNKNRAVRGGYVWKILPSSHHPNVSQVGGTRGVSCRYGYTYHNYAYQYWSQNRTKKPDLSLLLNSNSGCYDCTTTDFDVIEHFRRITKIYEEHQSGFSIYMSITWNTEMLAAQQVVKMKLHQGCWDMYGTWNTEN